MHALQTRASGEAKIAFSIPEKVKEADIYVYSHTGQLVRRFEIQERGYGNVVLRGSQIAAGSYNCTLVLDGEIKESVKLVKHN